MHPQLFSAPPIPSYGAMLLLAWAIGWWLTRRRARQFGIACWQVDWLMPLLLVSAGVGSRLASHCSQLLPGGAANDRMLFGGLLLAVLVAVVFGIAVRIPLARLADACAMALPVGIVLLRVGCFLAGCCWGDVCERPERLANVKDPAWLRQVRTLPAVSGDDWPLAVEFPRGSPAYSQHLTAGLLAPTANQSLRVHPVQLYEAVAVLVLWAFLRGVDGQLRRWGESLLLFGMGYATVRLVIEPLRADTEVLIWNLTASQLASISCFCACLVLWRTRLVARISDPGHT